MDHSVYSIKSLFILFLNALASQSLDYFDDICGETFNDRIISGKNASLGQFPWIARIQIRHLDGSYGFDCAGALISSRHVLSAAHCVIQDNGQHNVHGVLVGELNSETDPDCEDELCVDVAQFIRAESVFMPSDYDNPKNAHDILLIKLIELVQFNDFLMPICLPKGNELEQNDFAEVAGWGLTDSETESIPTILQYAKIQLKQMTECEKVFRASALDASRQICAGGGINEQGNPDSCNGDSGGALMQVLIGDNGPKYYVTGIVSFGLKKCGGRRPAVYTKISYYLNFILKNIDDGFQT